MYDSLEMMSRPVLVDMKIQNNWLLINISPMKFMCSIRYNTLEYSMFTLSFLHGLWIKRVTGVP
jgi:hypothetical protein